MDKMKPDCETIVTEFFPAIRAKIAIKLVTKHGISQSKAANLMNLTQPAISQYKRQSRGHKNDSLWDDSIVLQMIDSIAEKVAIGKLSPRDVGSELCTVCKYIRETDLFAKLIEAQDG